MPWPMSQDYNEAIQNPAQSFADADLKAGEAVCNALGLPVPCSGNFADVYAVQSGPRKWAVKCFTRQIPGLQERYVQISKYLAQVQLPFMVEFKFLEEGIRVRGQWYPVLKMQWVEGFQLNTFVRDNLDKPPVLQTLCQIWVRLAQRLREANLAHCDLQHGNVLIVPSPKAGTGGIKLVDYDGTCVPALELLKSVEVGHAAFQHPQRLREGTYGLQTDRFAHLVIYTALRGVAAGGKPLWDKYDNGDNLLFRQADFEVPGRSAIFQELRQSPDAEVRQLTQVLAQAAQGPIEQTPRLEDLVAGSQAMTARRKPVPVATAIPAEGGTWYQEGPQVGSATPALPVEPPYAQPVTPPKPARKRRLVPLMLGLLVLAGSAVGAYLAVPLFSANRSSSEAPVAQANPTGSVAISPAVSRRVIELPTERPPQPESKPERRPDTKPEPKVEPKPEPKVEPKPPAPELLKTEVVANKYPGKAFEETSKDEGLIVGFNIGLDSYCGTLPIIAMLQPIYLTPKGKKEGDVHGVLVGKARRVEAKDGYAVGGIVGRGGQMFEGMKIVFMRIKGDKLDPTDSYESPWIGSRRDVPEVTTSGAGKPVVGIQGSIAGFSVTGYPSCEAVRGFGLIQVAKLSNPIEDPEVKKDPEPKKDPDPKKDPVTPVPSETLVLDLGDEIKLELVLIKKGNFRMGSPAIDKNAKPEEQPQHEVTISKDFFLAKYPVTQEQFAKIMGKNPSWFCKDGNGKVKVRGKNTDRFPVETVSWVEAQEFCKKLSALTKKRVELPTEAQWEYACRAGTTSPYYCGETLNGRDANIGTILGRTSQVGDYPPNPWGLYDMTGNVFQWCADGQRKYTADKCTDPKGTDESVRVVRGGSWPDAPGDCRCAFRFKFPPSYHEYFNGIRVVVHPDSELKPDPTRSKDPEVKKDPPRRTAAPEAAAQDKAEKLIKDTYAADFAKLKTAEDRTALAAKLTATAGETKDDPAARFVLLREAGDLALQAGDVLAALKTVDQMAELYEFDVLAQKLTVLNKANKSATTKASNQALAEACLVVLQEALDAENFDVAPPVHLLAIAAAKNADVLALVNRTAALGKDMRDAQKEFVLVRAAVETLKKTPDDPDANLVRGKYLCGRKADWEHGLPLLAKGSDKVLRELARKDLAAPAAAAEQTAVGDGWWELAAKEPDSVKERFLSRSYFWYQQAVPQLSGLTKARVEKRLAEAKAQPTGPPTLTLDLGDGVKLELVRIKAGKFMMGSPESDKEAEANEKPQHEVTISRDFYLAKYPVTQRQYSKIMGKNPSRFCKDGTGKETVAGKNTDYFPVESVTWTEAQQFCARVSELTKRRLELPTEAEWEYACRAGKTSRYYCGDSLTAKEANFNERVGRTTKVGDYLPNAWDLHDMTGNVFQWCADGQRGYTKDQCTDPKGSDEGLRVVRGGSWFHNPRDCRCAFRDMNAPSDRKSVIGFRVMVRVDTDLEPKKNPETRKNPDPVPAKALTLDLGDGVKLELVRIKAGKFMMGSPESDKDAQANEKPQHEVTISQDFYMAKYHVTQEQYQKIMGKNPSYFCKDGGGKEKVAGKNTDRFPVETVTWTEAQEFCAKLKELTKRGVELPNEAEWEYTCRAGKLSRYYCGSTLTAKDANFSGIGRTSKVGDYSPNPWELCDMSGNVWQWCGDGPRKYAEAKCTDPKGPDEKVGALRGGAWTVTPEGCRCACPLSGNFPPSFRSSYIGFRVIVRLD